MGPLQCLPLHRASVSPAHTHSSSFLLTLCGLLPSCFPQSPTNLTQPALTLHQHGTEMLSTPRITDVEGIPPALQPSAPSARLRSASKHMWLGWGGCVQIQSPAPLQPPDARHRAG